MLKSTIHFLSVVLAFSAAVNSQQSGQSDPTPPAQESTQRTEPAPAVSAPVLGSLEPDVSDVPIEQHVVPVPAIIGGFGPTLVFSSSSARSNVLRAGLNVGASYDDNALIVPTDAISNWSYSIFPNISIQQTRSRVRWDLGYAGGLTVNQELSSRNQGSHDLNLNLLYRVSPHVNLILGDHFSLTTGAFSQLGSNAEPQTGPPSGPNTSVILPINNQLGNNTSAQLGYQFTANDAVGVSGGYYLTNYRDVPANSPQLFDTRSAQAAGFYTHRITARNWLGASYRFQKISFTGGSGETLIHSVLLFDTFTMPGKMLISVFAGPEYVDVTNSLLGVLNPSVRHKWSTAAGASYNWTGQYTSFFADFVRRVNDGGGLQGAVDLTTIGAGVRHQLGRSWTVAGGGSYGMNDSVVPGSGVPRSVKSSSVYGNIERKFGASFIALAGYSHDTQKGQDLSLPDATAHRNRVWVSLSYSFSRPLGR
jgi:hypothetical protein